MKAIEEIRKMLADRRLGVVAAAIGVHPTTLARLRDGKGAAPSYALIKAVSDYLEANP